MFFWYFLTLHSVRELRSRAECSSKISLRNYLQDAALIMHHWAILNSLWPRGLHGIVGSKSLGIFTHRYRRWRKALTVEVAPACKRIWRVAPFRALLQQLQWQRWRHKTPTVCRAFFQFLLTSWRRAWAESEERIELQQVQHGSTMSYGSLSPPQGKLILFSPTLAQTWHHGSMWRKCMI